MSNSKHTKRRFDGQGKEISRAKAFRECLPHHVRFVFWLAMDLRPIAIGLDEAFREFLHGLDPTYEPPARSTIWKIVEITFILTQRQLHNVMQKVKEEIGSPFFSLQLDMWTTRNMAESYISLNGSFITRTEDYGGYAEYHLEQALLAFKAFPHLRHTAVNIANWTKDMITGVLNFEMDDVCVCVPDGGANVRKIGQLTGLNARTCFAHQLQRCVLYALGTAGTTSRNPEMKAALSKAKQLASTVHHSTQITKLLASTREARKEKPMAVMQDVTTRWSSTHMMVQSLNLLQADLQSVFNSTDLNNEAMIANAANTNAGVESILDESESEDDEIAPKSVPLDADQSPTKLPRDHLLTEPEFAMTRAVEGFCAPASQVTLMLEGEDYVMGNKGYPSLKVLQTNYQSDQLVVPGQLTTTDRTSNRKYYAYNYDGLPSR